MIVDIHSHNLQPEHWGEEHKKNWEPAYGKPYPRVTPASFDAVLGPRSAIISASSRS